MIHVKPIIPEQWIVNGVSQLVAPGNSESLYIKPMLPMSDFVVNAKDVHHTLVLDNNVLTDLLEDRRPENNRRLENLFRSIHIEINPVFALTEQRQKYEKASDALSAYANYLKRTFGYEITAENIAEFESLLESGKAALIDNIEGLSGYLSVIIYLYHQDYPAAQKIEWLAGLIHNSDLPIFQIHFYFAGIVFLAKESPGLFQAADIQKIKEDMKIAKNVVSQKKKILNLSNDLALITTSIFQGGINNDVLVFPYVATRDRLCQLLLSQVTCEGIANAGKERVNGIWGLTEGGILDQNLGQIISHNLPRRSSAPTREDHLVRKSNLKAFVDLYINKIFEHLAPG